MYQIIYALFYLLSLLPWRVLYLISDAIYGIFYYLIGYRKKVVMKNLAIAFPEKTEAERVRIAKDFYHNFLDSFIEIIKLITISEKAFKKRITGNFDVLNSFEGKVPNVVIVSAHYFNWEFASLGLSLESKFQLLTVYMPIKNKHFDKLIYDMRKKFGAKLIPATDFRRHFLSYAKTNYALGLVSDQNPGDPKQSYWLPFFGKLTPFVKGAERTAKAARSGVVYLHFYRVRRGHYHFEFTPVTTDAKSYADGQLTKELIELTEKAIKNQPANYLWSHRRWKYDFVEAEHAHLLVK